MIEQARYQVRFDWGGAGLAAIGADADAVVLVDAVPGTPMPSIDACTGAVLLTGFRTATASARWVVDLQRRLGRRIGIAIVAVGATRPDGSSRLAVDDLLASGAVVAALGAEGLDATSPEAAVAEAAYLGLARGVGHLVSASASATGAPVAPSVARVDRELGLEAVEVLRPHPALAPDDGRGAKSSAREFMQ